MRTNLATRAGMLGVASAAVLSLAPAPAQAAAAPQTAVASTTAQGAAAAEAVFGQAVAKRAKWVTLKHQSKRVSNWSPRWDRKYGHRVMQVQARCWGKGIKMRVAFEYQNRWKAWRVMKSTPRPWPCDGRYRYLRVTNAGHKKYGATFTVWGRQTVEYWAQSYG
ncbi:hypothetical protein [Actinomadura kijaniata]|uniref:hypothetical protein n=1 Tax=Actinomadura kijaniata TaxID=46161 RepID=UPI0012F8E29D|nr:hypothetical protein [Actinomadura kijaniata]